jgi:hypothetical protein
VIIAIEERAGHLNAMGHRVPVHPAGLAEIKRRCLEGLSRLNDPPMRIWFRLPGDATDAPEPPQSMPAALPGPAKALPRESAPLPEPARASASQGQRQGRGRR